MFAALETHPPPGESAHKLLSERTFLSGIFLMCVTYGAELIIFLQTAYLLIQRRNSTTYSKGILVYVTTLFALATISIGCAIKSTEWDWVDNRNYPGGPITFNLVDGQDPIYLTMVMAFNLMSILQDGWLLYRFLIIWDRNWLAFTFPFLLYLSSIATSFLIWAEILMTGAPFLSTSHIDIALINWVLSISTNIVLTMLIILRILLARRRIKNHVGPEHLQVYTSIASILVESQAIYAVVGIVVLAGVKTNTGLVNVLANTFGLLEAFAPTLVAYRIACGTAWSQEKQRELSSIKFAGGGNTTLTPSGQYKSHITEEPSSPRALRTAPILRFASSASNSDGASAEKV